MHRVAASIIILATLAVAPALAQRGANGPIADLNAEAARLSDSHPEQSLALALKAEAAAHAAGDLRGEGEALNYIAYAHRAASDLAQARIDGQESVRLFKAAHDRWGEAQGYNTLGLIEADDGKFAEALDYHLKALAIREQDGDKEGLSYTYNNLGNAYRNMGEYQKALEYHQRGLQLKIALGNKSSEAFSHQNIGLVYFVMKDYPRALGAYKKSLEIREQTQETRLIAASLNSIGSVEAITDPEAALKTYARSLAIRREVGDTRGEMATLLNIADVHQKLRRWTDAHQALERAMAVGEKIDVPLMRSNALRAMGEVEAAQGNYADAYKHQLAYQQSHDAIFSQQEAERFHHLETARDAERKQQQIQLLERENALSESELRSVRNSRLALAIIVVLVLVSVALTYTRHRLAHESAMLRGLLPICAWCKKIREDEGQWTQLESFIKRRSAADFTHCICPSCYSTMTEEERSSGRA